jgi:hypothetical protein
MTRLFPASIGAIAAGGLLAAAATAQIPPPKGEIKGAALVHTAASAAGAIDNANIALPSAATGTTAFFGKWRDLSGIAGAAVPTVVFLHGSSGLGLPAIAEWQKALAEAGIASLAPDSFALPDRLTYTSPIGKDVYERIHALRASEIELALAAVKTAGWVDRSRLVLAGASEGATAVARDSHDAFAARLIYSWSCEDNYFVDAHRTHVDVDQPVLNVISSVDPFFSPSNAWLGNAQARGNCATAFAGAKRAAIVLVPGAPHTLIALPNVRAMTRAFLETALAR